MIDRVTISRRGAAWVSDRYPPDMHQVEAWTGAGVAIVYRDGGVWKDAINGLPLVTGDAITHWAEIRSSGI